MLKGQRSCLMLGSQIQSKILLFFQSFNGSNLCKNKANTPLQLRENESKNIQDQKKKEQRGTSFSLSSTSIENITLRGGGCGNSQSAKRISLQQNHVLLPPNFLLDLKRYIFIITSKANLAQDQQQQDEIIIAIQWFNVMKEHLNTICQDNYYSASAFNLILEQIPLMLKSSLQLIKISGFLCSQILQISNDLSRILFSYFLTNEGRFLKKEEKQIFLDLIQELQIELEIESTNIWVAGVEFEIEMIKAVVQSSPSNSDEGKQLLITFMGELVKSALSMSPSEGLIEALIGGASFLHAAYKTKNLKEKYEIYYFFQSLQWQVINALRKKDVSVKKILLLISSAYKTHIEKTNDWFLNFCWVKFVSFLIVYRPLVQKKQLAPLFGLEENWDSLITYKLIKQFSFDKNCGRVLFNQRQSIKLIQLDQILEQFGKQQFVMFQETLLANLKSSESKILSFKLDSQQPEKQQDYLSQILNENIEWKEFEEQKYYVDELVELTHLFKKELESEPALISDSQQRLLEIKYIKEKGIELIHRIFASLDWGNNTLKKLTVYLQRLSLIISSIEPSSSPLKAELIQPISEIIISYLSKCRQQNESLQGLKISLIQSISAINYSLEQLFYSFEINTSPKEIVQLRFPEIITFLQYLESFRNSIMEIITKISSFKGKYSQKCGKNESINLNLIASEILELIFTYIDIDEIKNYMHNIFQYFEDIAGMESDNSLIYIVKNSTLEYLLQDIIHNMSQKLAVIKQFYYFILKYQEQENQLIKNEIHSSENLTEQVSSLNKILKHQSTIIEKFFKESSAIIKQEGKGQVIDCVKVAEIVTMLRANQRLFLQMQKTMKNSESINSIFLSTIVIEENLGELLEEPNRYNEIQNIITEIQQNIFEELLSCQQEKQSQIVIKEEQLRKEQESECQQVQQAVSNFQIEKQILLILPQEQLKKKQQPENTFYKQEKKTDQVKSEVIDDEKQSFYDLGKQQQKSKLKQAEVQFDQNNNTDLKTVALSIEKFLSDSVARFQVCLKIIQKHYSLYERIWNGQMFLQPVSTHGKDQYALTKIKKIIKKNQSSLKDQFQSIVAKQFYLPSSKSNQIISSNSSAIKSLLFFLENLLCQEMDSLIIQNHDGILIEGKQVITNKIQNLKDQIENYTYKVRECFIMNLLFIEAAQLEPVVVLFCQSNLLQIWTSEKDERVKSLLRNTKLVAQQKKLFSHDLKSFTNTLQIEMKNRFRKLNELEQKIKLQGNIEIREQQQHQLCQLHLEFEEYLDNINDMTAKLDIQIIFLKEIKNDLTAIKQKIDKLQETVNDIGDDVRKLRGKTFQELLQIRKRKVLEQKKIRDLTLVYVPLNVLEYNPVTGKPEPQITLLLKDDFFDTTGEVNQFLFTEEKTKDVMLLKGLAGSGKSRAVAKIEEFLWEKNDLKQSSWYPVYVSLPSLKEPRFNLLEQALASEFYSFDKIQIKEFQEAVKKKELKIILILDSYDEMRQEFIESNLYLTNRLSQILFEENSTQGQISEYVKIIITTRSEILTSSTSYQTRFYGKSLDFLKEIELQGFDGKQQKEYLKQYTFKTVKQELYELYEFVKFAISEKIDLLEFNQFWKQVEMILTQSQHPNQGNMLTEEETNNIILITNSQRFFLNISQDQIINLRKRLLSLWSLLKFEDIIQKANIAHILTTPFMMEIVVQVLPSMMQKYSVPTLIKQNFISNFIYIRLQLEQQQQLINHYRNNRSGKLKLSNGELDGQKKYQSNFEKEANEKWDLLDSNKILQNFSILDEIEASSFFPIFRENSKIVALAFRMKELTAFDFYSSFTEFYHHKSIQKLREQGKIVNQEAFLMDVFDYSQSLALDLTIRELTQVKYEPKGNQN